MTKDDIEHLWKIASNDPNHDSNWFDPVVIKFAKLVAEHEREACAKVCEDIFYAPEPEGCGGDEYYYTRPYLHCAEAIRARGQA